MSQSSGGHLGDRDWVSRLPLPRAFFWLRRSTSTQLVLIPLREYIVYSEHRLLDRTEGSHENGSKTGPNEYKDRNGTILSRVPSPTLVCFASTHHDEPR
jgi:hypothetical protein